MSDENVKLDFAILCEDAFPSLNGNLNIIGMFTNISAKTKPATHRKMVLVLDMKVIDTNKHELKVLIKDPSEKETIKPYKLELPRKEGFFGHILTILDTKLEIEGTYSVEIYIDDKLEKRINFEFKVKP